MIVAIDGTRVQNVDELLTEVEAHCPGDVVKVTVLRGGKLVDVPVKLGAVVSRRLRRTPPRSPSTSAPHGFPGSGR